jgi:hypothetical protein
VRACVRACARVWPYVAFVIQHANCLRRITLLSGADPALPYFSTLPHKRHNCRKTLQHIFLKFFLQLLPETFFTLRKIQRYIIITVYNLHVNYRLFLSVCNETWIMSTDFRKKKLKHQISWKFFQWKIKCSMRTDRQANMTNITVTFRNFAKASANSVLMVAAME